MKHGLSPLAAALALGGSLFAGMSSADTARQPPLSTNEAYINEAMAAPVLKINDPMAVFAYVLGSLPEKVKVYPTENYYYFKFFHNNVRYAGNIRLDVADRDQGKVHFAYFEDLTAWKGDEAIAHLILDSSRGVMVEKAEDLAYQITHGGKSVRFELNDLRHVKPPATALGPDEIYIGPVFDESAIRFFLVFNKRLKLFHYVLDETVPIAEQFANSAATNRILIGKRTGFAFYRDHRIDRKILIGVFAANSRVNNYFDGPFDQLPDNFIEGNLLLDAILAVEPQLKGKIDRLGISPGGEDRYSIAPYLHYGAEEDLMSFHTCATDKSVPVAQYYECFVSDDGAGEDTANGELQQGSPNQN